MLGHFVKDSKLLDQVLSEFLFTVPLTAVVLTKVLNCDVTLTAQVQKCLVCTLLILVKFAISLDKVECLLIEATLAIPAVRNIVAVLETSARGLPHHDAESSRPS